MLPRFQTVLQQMLLACEHDELKERKSVSVSSSLGELFGLCHTYKERCRLGTRHLQRAELRAPEPCRDTNSAESKTQKCYSIGPCDEYSALQLRPLAHMICI